MFKNNLARILSEKKKLEKISQAQIAREVGVTPSNITEWLKGRGSPGPEKLKILARVLGVSLSELVGENAVSAEPGWQILPLLGEVPAGNPVEAIECHIGHFSLPRHIARKVDFGLMVKGDSMSGAGIYDGDYVFVKCQPVAENRQIIVARIDGAATVKRFFKTDHSIILKPENNNFDPILVDQSREFVILGIVTGLWRMGIK